MQPSIHRQNRASDLPNERLPAVPLQYLRWQPGFPIHTAREGPPLVFTAIMLVE